MQQWNAVQSIFWIVQVRNFLNQSSIDRSFIFFCNIKTIISGGRFILIVLFVLGFNIFHHFYATADTDKDEAKAAREASIFEKDCKSGDMISCTNLGIYYRNGRGVPLDYGRAVKLYKKACEGGDVGGCNNLAVMYEHGYGVDRDGVQAAKLYQKVCDLGEAIGCNNIGAKYLKGQGVPQDVAKSRSC